MPHETSWPLLPYDAWKDTCSHLHLMTQIVGKIRLAQTPWVNHSWHVPLYLTPRGLTTGPIPHDNRIFVADGPAMALSNLLDLLMKIAMTRSRAQPARALAVLDGLRLQA
jgi:hypothetical protein